MVYISILSLYNNSVSSGVRAAAYRSWTNSGKGPCSRFLPGMNL